jgi:AcrR family transcriptional regulator
MMPRAKGRQPASNSKAGYHHGDLRRALIEAALSLIAERRGADLSIREVARRAGVTYAAPYHHFVDKSALLAAVACEGFQGLVSKLERAAARKASLESELQAVAEAYIAFAMEQPSHYRVMFLPEVKASADSEALHEAGERAFGLLLERVGRARPAAAASAREVVAATAWAALHGLALLAIDGTLQHMFPKPDKLLSQACRIITGMVMGGENA